jgi:transcription initiation factor TFIID TATA-box-binding protein
MGEVTIENIITYTYIADKLNIEEIAEKLPEFKFNPDEFSGLTLKLENPNAAVLLLPDGKAICTGTKKIEDAENAVNKTIEKLKDIEKRLKKNPKIEIQNIIASTDLKKEFNLQLISKELPLEKIDYEPNKFPGLIYRMDDIGASFLIFSSGKIICTGVKTTEEATNGIKMMEEKITSLGVS